MNRPDATARQHIVSALERFLKQQCIEKITVAAEGQAPPPLAFLVHFHRISVTVSGVDENELALDGKPALTLTKPGEILFIPANRWNRPTWRRRSRVLHFLFGKRHMGISLVNQRGTGVEPPASDKAGLHCAISDPLHQILNAFAALAPAQQQGRAGWLLVGAILQLCAGLLRAGESRQGRKGRDTYERICLHVHENFHRPISRDTVARHFRLNPGHVSRLFRAEGSVGFNEFLTARRIRQARDLLKNPALTVDEVAAACGFTDTSYFCKVFKRQAQMTPSHYRGG
ncbi:MAG: helix-turn-helix transcriptional regulator [Verrucomicrobiales bacterium]|jgi:AraC-like DNA-binding protein|nr:helix-turn-helix transcriptional regulator [Verrucomicrobiales bacterium]